MTVLYAMAATLIILFLFGITEANSLILACILAIVTAAFTIAENHPHFPGAGRPK